MPVVRMDQLDDAAEPGPVHGAPPLQPLLEEVKMSYIQLSWKAGAGLEFPLANHNFFNSFYRKDFFFLKEKIQFAFSKRGQS